MVASRARKRRSPRSSDDIAYDAHDIDDGLRADLFTLDDIAAVPLIGDIAARDRREHFPRSSRRGACTRPCAALITRMIEDVIAETDRRVAAHKPARPARCATPSGRWSAFRRPMEKADAAIKGFL